MNSRKILKQIRLIYFIVAILLGVFAILSFVYVMQNGPMYELNTNDKNNLKSLIIILALAGIPASHMFQSRKIKHLNKALDASKKLLNYRMAYFVKIMTLEGISLLSLLGYLIIGNLNQLLIFAVVYLFLVLNYPKKSAILEELNIDESEL